MPTHEIALVDVEVDLDPIMKLKHDPWYAGLRYATYQPDQRRAVWHQSKLFMLAMVAGVVGQRRCPVNVRYVRSAILAGIVDAMTGQPQKVNWDMVSIHHDDVEWNGFQVSYGAWSGSDAGDDLAISFLDLAHNLFTYRTEWYSDGWGENGFQEVSEFNTIWREDEYSDTARNSSETCGSVRKRVLDQGAVARQCFPETIRQSIKLVGHCCGDYLEQAVAFGIVTRHAM